MVGGIRGAELALAARRSMRSDVLAEFGVELARRYGAAERAAWVRCRAGAGSADDWSLLDAAYHSVPAALRRRVWQVVAGRDPAEVTG